MMKTHIANAIDDSILIDRYIGAYGQTVLINVPTEDLMRKLRTIFERLTESEPICYKLEELEFIKCENNISLTIDNRAIHKRAFRLIKSDGIVFQWSKSPEAWKDTVELANSLVPCSHEYLTDEENDDALVMLAFKEGLTIQ